MVMNITKREFVSRSVVFSTVVVAGLAVGCRNQATTVPPAPPEVTVATPEVRDVTLFQDFTGNTEAIESVEIRARVQGFLETVSFEPSSFVRKGQLLFTIEQEPYLAARDRAAAYLASAEAGLRRAESDLDRLEEAVKTNAVSEQEVTRARAERDQASAGLLEATAALTSAELQLGYTTVESPINGLVSRRLVDRGNLVGAGEATLLTTVRTINPIYAYFEMNERLLARILEMRSGYDPDDMRADPLPVSMTVPETGVRIDGEIDWFDNTVDAATGTIRVRGEFPNPDALVFPGFFVTVRIPGEDLAAAVLVEETAIGTDLGGRYVLVVGDDDIVERRYIEPGPLQEDQTRVVFEGLEAGERYIVKGIQRARPGMPVTVKSGGAS
jgi:RND family efflux transporter MFP subunit